MLAFRGAQRTKPQGTLIVKLHPLIILAVATFSTVVVSVEQRTPAEPRRIQSIGPSVTALSWQGTGERMRAMGFDASAYQDGNEAERDALDAIARASPASSLGKRFPEMNRDGTPRRGKGKSRFVALAPEAQESFAARVAETVGRLAPFRVWKYLNIAPEKRPHGEVSFDPVTRQAWRKASGLDIPEAILQKTGVDYRALAGFPETRIVVDQHPILAFYRWLWREGDGWPCIYNAAHRAVRTSGRDDVTSYVAPALRVPSLPGANGDVDALFHWGYIHPDPTRIGKCADELLAMAHDGNRKQRTIMMTQLFTKRSYVTPKGMAAEAADASLDLSDSYFTITPEQLEIAFWSKVSRPLDHIAYNGLRNIMPEDCTVPAAGDKSTPGRLRDLLTTILKPLGSTFAVLEDPPPRVGFLQSFTAEMFAGRGSYGWPFRNWQDDAYMALLYNSIQPRILYDDIVLAGGLVELDAIVLVHCDVLSAGVAEKILAFQKRGGIVVADEHLAPGIQPNILWKTEPISEKAAKRKETVIRKGKELREQLEPRVRFPIAVSNPDLVARLRLSGAGRYLFLVNDARRSGNTQGRYGLVLEDGLPLQATVHIQGNTGAVYDLRRGKAIPFRNEQNCAVIDLDFAPGEGTVLLLLDQPVGPLKLHAEPTTTSGSLPIRVSVHDEQGNILPAAFPVFVEVSTPSGHVGEFTGWHTTRDGTLTLPIAPVHGGQRVKVREGVSGKSVSLSVNSRTKTKR